MVFRLLSSPGPLRQEQGPLLLEREYAVRLLEGLEPVLRLLEALFVGGELLLQVGRLRVAVGLKVLLLEVIHEQVQAFRRHARVFVLSRIRMTFDFLKPSTARPSPKRSTAASCGVPLRGGVFTRSGYSRSTVRLETTLAIRSRLVRMFVSELMTSSLLKDRTWFWSLPPRAGRRSRGPL